MNQGGGDTYYNPNPLCRLVGKANELDVIVKGQTMKALIDLGAQISAISSLMQKALGVPLKRLEVLLEIEGSAGVDVPYLGYTEVNLQIHEIKNFNEDVLMLVNPDSKYIRKVPDVLGTLHIDALLEAAIEEGLKNLTLTWGWGSIGRKVLAKQLNFWTQDEQSMIDKIDSQVKLTRTVTIPPMQVCKASGVAKLLCLNKQVNVAVEGNFSLSQ